jgi:hypothetical protein
MDVRLYLDSPTQRNSDPVYPGACGAHRPAHAS